MLEYKFIEIIDNEYLYEYYPEGNKNASGKVGIKVNGNKRVIKESEDDFGKRYAHHALNGIDIKKKNGTVAWY